MSKENMTAVKGGDFGVKWNIKTEEFRKDSPTNYREGYYTAVNQIEMPGKKPFNVYSIQPVEKDGKFGEIFSVAGDKVLDNKLETVALKSFVGLEYLGKKPNKQAGMNPFNDWFVGVDASQPKYEDAQKKSVEAGGSDGKTVTQQASTSTTVTDAIPQGNGNIADDDLPF